MPRFKVRVENIIYDVCFINIITRHTNRRGAYACGLVSFQKEILREMLWKIFRMLSLNFVIRLRFIGSIQNSFRIPVNNYRNFDFRADLFLDIERNIYYSLLLTIIIIIFRYPFLHSILMMTTYHNYRQLWPKYLVLICDVVGRQRNYKQVDIRFIPNAIYSGEF